MLETGSSTLGQVIDERRLLELPQKGGDPFELMRLVPGVVNLTTLRTMKSSSPEGTSQISVNGSGVDQTQFQIDGINDTTNDTGKNYARVAFIPPSDAIVEFKMQANPYDACDGPRDGSGGQRQHQGRHATTCTATFIIGSRTACSTPTISS